MKRNQKIARNKCITSKTAVTFGACVVSLSTDKHALLKFAVRKRNIKTETSPGRDKSVSPTITWSRLQLLGHLASNDRTAHPPLPDGPYSGTCSLRVTAKQGLRKVESRICIVISVSCFQKLLRLQLSVSVVQSILRKITSQIRI